MMCDNPILITGVYRSGTTILSTMLNAHPGLDVTYDSVNYFRFVIKKGLDPANYRDIVHATAERILSRYKRILDPDQIISEIEKSDHIGHDVIYSAIMNNFFNYSGKRWGEKTLLEWSNIPIFLSMFPKGEAIHIIRDPRDVLASYKHMTIETGYKYLDSVFACMHSMNAAIRNIRLLPPNRYYVLIYEELIKDKKRSLTKLCEFLDLDYADSMLNEKAYVDISGKSFDLATHTSFPEETVVRKKVPIGQWMNKLDDFEVNFVESFLREPMKELGYKLSDNSEGSFLSRFITVINDEPLLKERIRNYVITGDGVESYPSDPTDPKNWGCDTGISGQGAAAAYGLSKKRADK